MAFGLEYINGAEEDKFKRIQKLEKEQSQEENQKEQGVATSNQSPTQRRSFQRRQPSRTSAPTKASQSSPAPSYQSMVKDAHVAERDKVERLIEGEDEFEQDVKIKKQSRGKVFENEKLTLNAIRLAQDVAEFKKYSLDELHTLEKRARDYPNELILELKPIYENEILPAKRKLISSFKDQIMSNQGKIVFMLKKGNAKKVNILDPTEHPSERLLHGCFLESVYASSTPFPPSNEIIELSIASNKVNNEVDTKNTKKPSIKP